MSQPSSRSVTHRFFRHRFFRQLWRGLGLLLIIGFTGLLLSQTINSGTATFMPEPTAIMTLAETEEFGQAEFDQAVLPLPQNLKFDPDKVNLGQRLFHEPRLSRNQEMSCATCHNLNDGGSDGLPRSLGNDGKPLAMNSPTVLNSGFNFRQFWDGRVVTLEEQVGHPLENPQEMNLSWDETIARLRADPEYQQQFSRVYGKHGISPETVSSAIATFQRSLITPSRFDQFLRGDGDALSKRERIGYEKFQLYGCAGCHQGVNLGGTMFQRLDSLTEYRSPQDRTAASKNAVSKKPAMNATIAFKVPTLRNITLTAPYLHDGSIDTLPEVIQLMAQSQLGRTISSEDVSDLVAFLQSLTGEMPPHVASQPTTHNPSSTQSQGA